MVTHLTGYAVCGRHWGQWTEGKWSRWFGSSLHHRRAAASKNTDLVRRCMSASPRLKTKTRTSITTNSRLPAAHVTLQASCLLERLDRLVALYVALNPNRLLTSSEENSTVAWSVRSHTVPGGSEPESWTRNKILAVSVFRSRILV